MLPQHGHERVGIKGKQEQNSAIPHAVLMLTQKSLPASGGRANTRSWRFDGLTPCISWRERGERSLAEGLAAAYAQWKHIKELKVRLYPDGLSGLEGVYQCLQLNLDKIRYI